MRHKKVEKLRRKLIRERKRKKLKLLRLSAGRSLKFTRTVYSLVQILIFAILAYSVISLIFRENKERAIVDILQCILAIFTINLPAVLQNKLKWYIPSWFQLFAVLFICSHFIAGEIFRVYDISPVFDKVLHTLAGLASALLGFSMVNILNNNFEEHKRLSPFFVAVFSFCFALAVSYVWEMIEFFVDTVANFNMQRWKDYVVLDPEGKIVGRGSGLIDTMIDMIVMAIGGLVVSVMGYFALKHKSGLIYRLMVVKVTDYHTSKKQAIEQDNAEMLNIIEEIYNSPEQ